MVAYIDVRVEPRARAAGLKGRMADGTWKLMVTAPPEGGRANQAVVDLLASILGLRGGQLSVARGQSARRKRIKVEGLDEGAVSARLDRALRSKERDGE